MFTIGIHFIYVWSKEAIIFKLLGKILQLWLAIVGASHRISNANDKSNGSQDILEVPFFSIKVPILIKFFCLQVL